MNSDSQKSAQPCGCDEGAAHVCAYHTELAGRGMLPEPVTMCGTGIDWSPLMGIKGARPKTAAERKTYPVATGVLGYFPKAMLEIAHVSYVGNEQHNPGKILHWDRSKSADESDALIRHFLERGTLDTDGLRHTAKVAWRALAMLEKELEQEGR